MLEQRYSLEVSLWTNDNPNKLKRVKTLYIRLKKRVWKFPEQHQVYPPDNCPRLYNPIVKWFYLRSTNWLWCIQREKTGYHDLFRYWVVSTITQKANTLSKQKKNKLFSLSHSLATIRIVAFRIVKISAKREKINYLDFSSWTTNSGSTKLSLMTLKIFKALLMIKLNYRKINPWYKNRQNPRFAIDKSNEGKINESTFIV